VKTRITASSLDRAIACPASTALPAVWEESSPAAERGIAIHEFLDGSITHGRDAALAKVPADAPWRPLCEAIDLSLVLQGAKTAATELALAYDIENDSGRVIGSHLNRRYGDTTGEVPCTADLAIEYESGPPLVLDWKAGHQTVVVHENRQMEMLGLAYARAKQINAVQVAVAMVHDSGFIEVDDVLVLGPMELARIANDVANAVDASKEMQRAVSAGEPIDVRPGDHCRYCPCKAACPAQVGLIRELARAPGQSLGPLLGDAGKERLATALRERIATLDADAIGRAWQMLGVIESLVETARSQLTNRILESGGLTMQDGSRLDAQTEKREGIDGRIALPLLRTLNLEEAAEPKVTKAAIEREARRATPNDRDAAKRKFEDALAKLRDAGAITTSSYKVVRVKAPAKSAAPRLVLA
jgi:hypothetical protein